MILWFYANLTNVGWLAPAGLKITAGPMPKLTHNSWAQISSGALQNYLFSAPVSGARPWLSTFHRFFPLALQRCRASQIPLRPAAFPHPVTPRTPPEAVPFPHPTVRFQRSRTDRTPLSTAPRGPFPAAHPAARRLRTTSPRPPPHRSPGPAPLPPRAAAASPWRKGSMSTSARQHSRLSAAAPAGRFRSSAKERLPRPCTSAAKAVGDGRSTRTTRAPKSARIMPQSGAGARPASSSTRTPLSAMAAAACRVPRHRCGGGGYGVGLGARRARGRSGRSGLRHARLRPRCSAVRSAACGGSRGPLAGGSGQRSPPVPPPLRLLSSEGRPITPPRRVLVRRWAFLCCWGRADGKERDFSRPSFRENLPGVSCRRVLQRG